LVAIIVPDKDHLMKWAKEAGLGDLPFEGLLKIEQVTELYKNELHKKAKEAEVSLFIKNLIKFQYSFSDLRYLKRFI
jgi:long-subunit acyl-CoA synthetase (AMP-forming)